MPRITYYYTYTLVLHYIYIYITFQHSSDPRWHWLLNITIIFFNNDYQSLHTQYTCIQKYII
jgi:hypothetical protein